MTGSAADAAPAALAPLPAASAERAAGFAVSAARRDLYGDAFNESVAMRPGQWLTRLSVYFDNRGVDGLVNTTVAAVGGSSGRLRRVQNGMVRSYLLTMLVGAIPLAGSVAVALIPGPSASDSPAGVQGRNLIVKWVALGFTVATLGVAAAMLIGSFAATDVFLFYVFFEAMLVPMYFLLGGLLMLVAVIALFVYSARGGHPGTFLFSQLVHLQLGATVQKWLFAGFFTAFAIKAPLWPFHTWLPDAATSALPGDVLGWIPDAVYVLGHDERLVYSNQPAADLAGLPAGCLTGMTARAVFPGDWLEAYRNCAGTALAAREPGCFRAFCAPLDCWLEWTVLPRRAGVPHLVE